MPANSQGIPGADVSATANFTLNHGLTFRVSERDDTLTSANSDDGDRNYGRGLVSNTSSLTAEFELTGENLGLFVRMHGFVDFENMNGARETIPLSDAAKDVAGRGFRLLDLYASGAFDPGGVPLDLRVGNQVLNWGESTFIPNGINVINPIDVNRLRTPGSELRDALLPVPMVYAAVEPIPDLSVEGFYQFGWEKTEIDPVGTYFSSNDYVGAGGRYARLTLPDFAKLSDGVRAAPGLEQAINADLASLGLQYDADEPFPAIERAADQEPPDDGQYGMALRYLSPALNDAEFGFYFVNAHSRLPLVTGKVPNERELLASLGVAGDVGANRFDKTKRQLATLTAIGNGLPPAAINTPQGQAAIGQVLASPEFNAEVGAQIRGLATYSAINRYAKAARYFVEYPEDLRTVGVSFNTVLGSSGWALQGEYSYHPDLPLQREEDSLFAEALAPIGCYLEASANPAVAALPADRRPAAIGRICAGQVDMSIVGNNLKGHVKRNVSQAQVTATQVFGSVLGSDSTGFIAEAATMIVHDMPDSSVTKLDTAGARGDIADKTSWGYRGAVWLDYHNAIGAARLTPYLQFQHDVSGSSPAPFGPFVGGRKVLTLGVGANYLERMSADLSYTMHGGHHNALEDRDFVSISFNYSF
ncbi:MAG: DUF1302 domain-containing protein [Boseongicola sp.]|nr:DUF1302 domain-containing protein [Boseongicola sp.]